MASLQPLRQELQIGDKRPRWLGIKWQDIIRDILEVKVNAYRHPVPQKRSWVEKTIARTGRAKYSVVVTVLRSILQRKGALRIVFRCSMTKGSIVPAEKRIASGPTRMEHPAPRPSVLPNHIHQIRQTQAKQYCSDYTTISSNAVCIRRPRRARHRSLDHQKQR